MKPFNFLVLFVYLLLASCSNSSIHPKQYISWVNEESNGLIQRKEMGDFEVLVSYKPQQYVALIEVEKAEGGLHEFEERLKEIEGNQYFTIRIDSKDKKTESLKAGITSQQEYFSRIEYLTSGFYQDVYLIDGTDTLPCLLHHFERTYHMASYTDINVVFENKFKDKLKDKTLVIDDRIFGLGLLRFNFSAHKLNDIPKLTSDT